MNKIVIMSELLANKIAAGEVIERTSSIIKELVENAIDAKAKNIKINLLDGGLKEIKVNDDGVGMNKEDAVLAFSRHATSKIKKDDDLFFINTLGFRGEALPSIASISEVVLITNQSDMGTKVHLKGGKIIDITNSDARKGTDITVNSLFYNTPARLKFLKSESSELSATTNLIEKLALSHPTISFTLTNNEKTIIKTTGSDNLHKAIHEIYGLNVSNNMLYIEVESDDYLVRGYVSKPSILKTNRNDITTFVNDRLVKNFDINKAINDAYYTYKPNDRYPIAVLNIYTDPTLMDVNIHPTKQDIKLSKMDDLYSLIYKGIKDLLYKNLLIPKIEVENNPINEGYVEPTLFEQKAFDLGRIAENEKIIKNEELKSLVLYPIALALGTYIIAENEEGIYLIDQHAAAERINYEKYMKALKDESINIKEMLIPIPIEFLSSDFMKFKENAEQFKSLGFEFKDFGINTIIVSAHPDYLLQGYEEESIRKTIELILNLNTDFDMVKFQEKMAITLACKMSIKANMKISLLEMEYLLDELVKCDNPYNCPHGRPTVIKYSLYDLEKLFKRVM